MPWFLTAVAFGCRQQQRRGFEPVLRQHRLLEARQDCHRQDATQQELRQLGVRRQTAGRQQGGCQRPLCKQTMGLVIIRKINNFEK